MTKQNTTRIQTESEFGEGNYSPLLAEQCKSQ
jgi:hypothetical protein